MTPDRVSAVRELLDFYVEAGVDAPVGEVPANRLAPAAAEAAAPARVPERAPVAYTPTVRPEIAPAPSQFAPPASPATPTSPDIAVMAARETARSAASLDELRAILAAFEGCALRTT